MDTSDLAGRRVLIVEDESVIAMDLAESLTAQGAHVVGPAVTIETAFDLIGADGRLDVAVLDMQLDRACDFGIADALLARGVPFIFSTGLTAADIPGRFFGTPCCEKPMEADAIAYALAEEIRARTTVVAAPVP